MKTIIVYYSFTGNNEQLAYRLKEKLNCDLEEIVELKRRKKITILFDLLLSRQPKIEPTRATLERYDLVILVAPVWDAKIAMPIKTFLRREMNNIREYAFITMCSGRKGQRRKLVEQLFELAYHEPVAVKELKVNDLLPPEQRDRIKYTTAYRIREADLAVLDREIEDFISKVTRVEHRTAPVKVAGVAT